jgi:hypothetical protein
MSKPDCELPSAVYMHSNITKQSIHIKDFATGLEAQQYCFDMDKNRYFHHHYYWVTISPNRPVNS